MTSTTARHAATATATLAEQGDRREMVATLTASADMPTPNTTAERLARIGAVIVAEWQTMSADARHAFRFTPSGRARRDAVIVTADDGRTLAVRRHPWQVTDRGRTVIVEHHDETVAETLAADDDETPREFTVKMTGAERVAYDYDGTLAAE